MKIGRNDLCYCGSGKKYKKCCLDKKPEVSHFQGFEESLEGDIRSMVMSRLETMVDHLSQYRALNKRDLDQLIQETAVGVNQIIAPSQSFMGDFEGKASVQVMESFSRNERHLIFELCKSFKMEYLMLTAAATPDYGMMKIMALATLKILQEGIKEDEHLNLVTIDYYGQDELVGYHLTYSDNPSSLMYWCNAVEQGVEFEQSKIENSLAYLSEEEKENLAAITNLEEKYNKQKNKDISYTTLVANYLNIIKSQLLQNKDYQYKFCRIFSEEGAIRPIQDLLREGIVLVQENDQKIVCRINRACQINAEEIPMVELLEDLGSDDEGMLEKLSQKVACGEKISKQEYELFKSYIKSNGLLEAFSIKSNERELKYKHSEIFINSSFFSAGEIKALDRLFEAYVKTPYMKDYEYKLDELHKKIPFRD